MSSAAQLARGFADLARLDPGIADQLAMVMEEWVANVVEHGAPRASSRIVLHLRLSERHVMMTVSDAGRAFDPRAVSFAGPNHSRGGGAGLALIASLCRITTYARRSDRNRVTLELPLG